MELKEIIVMTIWGAFLLWIAYVSYAIGMVK